MDVMTVGQQLAGEALAVMEARFTQSTVMNKIIPKQDFTNSLEACLIIINSDYQGKVLTTSSTHFTKYP